MKNCFSTKSLLILALMLAGVAGCMVTSKTNSMASEPNTCLDNKHLHEQLVIPNKQDSLNYQEIVQRYAPLLSPGFEYEYIPLSRGLVDTGLLNPEHLKQYAFLPRAYLMNFMMSPLIIKGEVVKRINADTSVGCKHRFYGTSFEIRIKDVIKTRYKVAVGDRIIAKTNLYGYYRSTFSNKVVYSSFAVPRAYEVGKTYLFVLNKYHYMYNMYKIKTGYKSLSHSFDEYCPTAFGLTITTHVLSQAYDKGELSTKPFQTF